MSDLGKSGGIPKTAGKVAGKGLVALQVASDGVGVYNYYKKGPNNPNSVSPTKAVVNTGFGVYGIWNPIVGITYGGLELFYPGVLMDIS